LGINKIPNLTTCNIHKYTHTHPWSQLPPFLINQDHKLQCQIAPNKNSEFQHEKPQLFQIFFKNSIVKNISLYKFKVKKSIIFFLKKKRIKRRRGLTMETVVLAIKLGCHNSPTVRSWTKQVHKRILEQTLINQTWNRLVLAMTVATGAAIFSLLTPLSDLTTSISLFLSSSPSLHLQ
jgi:hypothetical protein